MSLELLKRRLSLVVAGVSGVLFFSVAANAASVYNCSASGLRCVVKVEEGIIGDHVKVLNEKARVIASGRIVKRKGSFAVVAVKGDAAQTIRKGYPVIVDVENRDSNLQWAASFSNKD